ncbi:cyclophilin-like domain-containing protein, partial [Cyathus striatus]
MALPTKGRVIIETTAGEIDIELWAKETPKTCRNFLALAMEGYYDGVIFHRIVPNFLVQTGDRTGTGAGGESFYGEPFEDEIHPRLRFAHRGLVAMANNGTKNSNDSQFFITLDRADELHGKHTLFGRCIGDTIFNVMKIGEMEIDKNERPVYPPKIKSIRIVDNPFDDIVPRITAEEKRVQLRAREQAQREREEEGRRKGAKKNVKLLSFGADEEATEDNEPVVFKKKAIFRPDLVDVPEAPKSVPDFVVQPAVSAPRKMSEDEEVDGGEKEKKGKGKEREKDDDITKIREKHKKEKEDDQNSRKAQIEKMESEIRKLSKRDASDDEDHLAKKPKKSYLEEELAKYAKGRGLHSKKAAAGKKRDEGDILAALSSFRGKLQGAMALDEPEPEDGEDGEREGGEEGMEVDNDTGFMSHLLNFPKDNMEEVNKAERDYEVIDPRARGAKAKEEERERKRLEKERKGRGGRYRR